jgi:hypothetical protein
MRAGLGICVLVAACNGGDIVIGAARDLANDAGDASVFVPAPCWPCSADLRSVVACDGRVIQQCPPGQACRPDPARCEAAPCTAAAENFTTIGCDFFLLEPDASPPGAPTANAGACWAVLVANAWTEPMAMWFEHGNDPTSIDASPNAFVPQRVTNDIHYEPLASYGDVLPPGKMAVVFIASDVGNPQCPPTVDARFSSGDFAIRGTGRQNALRLRTSVPATAVDVYPYGGPIAAVPSAAMLLPTSSWGNSTLGVTAWPIANGSSYPGLAIVSLGSTVSILPPVPIAGGPGVVMGPKNVPTRYVLDPASILQFEQPEDLSGSLMTLGAGAQFSVWAIHKCMSIPSGSCDGAHLELPPSQALGSKFAAARFASRTLGEESVPWRLTALSDGTVLSFDPPTIQSTTVLNAGQSITIDAPGPFFVASQDLSHPVWMTEHMTRSPGAIPEGDPETVPVVPIEQWLTSYTFAVEPTYRDTSLVVIQARSTDGSFQDVTLDCLPDALSAWQPIGSQGKYRFTRVELENGGQAVDACDYGAHNIASRGPISVTVWEMDDSTSLAYPAGAGIRRINSVNVITTPK